MSRLSVPVTEEDHCAGPEDAPVTLLEYGDFECPHCRRAHPVVGEVQRRLGRMLRFVYRHFPLAEIHPHAQRAAEAAEAAGVQGRFWAMHDMLFENQDALDDPDLLRYAMQLNLDVKRFARELDDGVHAARVRRDFLSGVRSGVNGTPSFFVNGVRYDDWELPALLATLERVASERLHPAGRV